MPGQWVSIGPSLILGPVVDNGQYKAVGRLTTMAVDPRDPNIIYVGSPGAGGDEGSGVWKTTDGGTSWTPIADNLPGLTPSLAVDAIALDPTNPDRVYVVIYQSGLYRSDDAGRSWTHVYNGDLHVRTNIGPDGDRTVLLINPLDPRMLYLTTDLGVQRSTDGGQSWQVSLSAGNATSLVMDPQDPKILYAAISNSAGALGIYKTVNGSASMVDGGASCTVPETTCWEPQYALPFGNMPYRNILLAISHPASDAHETVYALFPRGPVNKGDLFGGIGYDLFRTTDGSTWSKRFTCSPDLINDPPNSYEDCNFAVMIADPLHPDNVYLGGVLLWLSSDGGANFERVPSDYHNNIQPSAPHVDYWELVIDPLNPKFLYVVNDGGIYKSSDYGKTGTWSFIGEGITNAEMHDLALAKSLPNRAIAGTGDNGTIRYDGNLNWHQFAGGDGGAVAIDPNDADRFYFSGNFGEVSQSPDGGTTFHDFRSGIPDEIWKRSCAAYDETFQLLIYPMRSEPVLDACVSLWRTIEINSTGNWNPIFTPTSENVVRVAIDPSSDLYYAGTDLGRVYAGLGGADWVQVFAHPDSLKLSDIEVDSAHPNTIYASFAPAIRLGRNCSSNAGGSRIYQLQRSSPTSASLAITPLDITKNLRAGRCVNALAIDPHIPRTVYAATDKGMYRGRSNATGGPWVWESYNNGMPPADVRDLELDASTGQLYAATFGRGALKVTLETSLPVSIDIKPDTSENIINIKNKGKIPVAILSSLTFDAPSEVDKTSLTFGHTGNEVSLALCDTDAQDVNGDGLLDQVCHFYTSLTGIQVSDTAGFLKGLTVEGVPIEGSDAVRILKQ